MHTIRRLYLYAVAFVSLETLIWGMIGLVRSIISTNQSGSYASSLAGALSLILVGIPVFLLHWWLAQRSVRQDTEERSSRLRAVFLYGALLATLIPAIQNILALLERLFLMIFALNPQRALLGGNQTLSDNLIAIAINVLAAAYFFWVLRADWQSGPEGFDFLETRRLYHHIWLIYSLGLAVLGISQLIQSILAVDYLPGNGPNVLLSNGLALMLAGFPLWYASERAIHGSLAEPDESGSLLRMGVLYLLSIISILGALISLSLVLNEALRVALGARPLPGEFLAQIANPLSIAVPLGAVWVYYRRVLRAGMNGRLEEPAQGKKNGRAANLHRNHSYVLALFGLAGTFAGVLLLLGFVLDLTLGRDIPWAPLLRDRLAQAFSILVVSLPLWILAWRPIVAEAAQEGEAGDHARRSLIRKSYLYLILFAGVVGLMFSAGALLFQVISTLLGVAPQNLLLELLQQLRILLLFALLLGYHWMILRTDGRMAESTLAKRHAQYPVLILAPDNETPEANGEQPSSGDFAAAITEALQRQAPALPVAVHPFRLGVPDETLSAARAVILPTELVARPSEALRLWLQAFSGQRIVVPTPTSDWHWVPGGGRRLAAMAQQTAQIIRHLAEGQEPSAPREASPWVIAIYVLAGLFALQIVLGLVAYLVSLLPS